MDQRIFVLIGAILVGVAPLSPAADPPKKEIDPTAGVKLDEPKAFKEYLLAAQDDLIKALAIENPLARDNAVKANKPRLESLVHKIIAVESGIKLTEKPYSVVATGAMFARGTGDEKRQVRVEVLRNMYSIRAEQGRIEFADYSPRLMVPTQMTEAAFSKLNGKETVRCWGVVQHWQYDDTGRNITVTVEGIVETDPAGNAVKRENTITTGTTGRRWRGKLLYPHATWSPDDKLERMDVTFQEKGVLKWEPDGDDKYVGEWNGGNAIPGKYEVKDGKVTMTLSAKRVVKGKEPAEFTGEFTGTLRKGFLIEGTFTKDRAHVFLEVEKMKIEREMTGRFQLLRLSDD